KPEAYTERHQVSVDTVYFHSVIDGMAAVMKPGGTAWSAAIREMEICGKTGTSQNPHGKDHSLFIGFAPRNNPKIAVAVIVENAGYGATWAAPIASLMMERFVRGKDVPSNAPVLLERMTKPLQPLSHANEQQGD
ncbi:MAG: penicillin-binding transpeptidase domain-containing protein, partial [Bacteroidota bacterium]